MADIKIDLAEQDIKVKVRRALKYIMIDNEKESIEVAYSEVKYTGVIGKESYNEITNNALIYEADFDKWMDSATGAAIKSAIEIQLALDVPGS